MIYFAQPTNGGPIRIGSSSLMNARRRTLGTWLPGGIETIIEFPGGFLAEAILHQCFNPLRVERDWFKSCDAVWKFILEAREGVPSWLPVDDGKAPKFDHAEITQEFGGVEAAPSQLGYSSQLNFDQAGRWQTGNGYVYASRILFQRLLRTGALPAYITDMHVPSEPASQQAAA